MFLAQDRILCLGIYTKSGKSYSLKYFRNSGARTDAVETFQEFLNQRRRWINSSWFASIYVLHNFARDNEKSGHGFWGTASIYICMLYSFLGNVNTYLIPAFYYLTLHICSYVALQPYVTNLHPKAQPIAMILPLCYVFVVLNLLFLCLLFQVTKIKPMKFPEQPNCLQSYCSTWFES